MTKIISLFKKYTFLEKFLIIFALFFGVLGLTLYFLGLISLFYRPVVIGISIFYLLVFIFLFIKINPLVELKKDLSKSWEKVRVDRLALVFLVVFIVIGLANFIVALSPETGFDALWYHLTLPKIYFSTHQIRFIDGGNLYYSVMPRLVEMIYGSALAFNPSAYLPKITHCLFGFMWFSGTYVFGRLFLSRSMALFSALIIYGTGVVFGVAQTAYIDMAVAFYLVMAFWVSFRYFKTKEKTDLYLTAIFLGLELSSKTFALFLLPIFAILIWVKSDFKTVLKFTLVSIAIPAVFYLQAYLATGQLIYPSVNFINPSFNAHNWYLFDWWKALPKFIFKNFAIYFTPILSLIPFVFFVKNWRKMIWPLLILLYFVIMAALMPFQDPRYFLVILPIAALIIGFIVENMDFKLGKFLTIFFAVVIVFLNLYLSLNYFKENIRVVLGRMSKDEYLKLYTAPAFYDSNGFLDKYTAKTDRIWTVYVGNKFYFNRSFADWDFDPAWRENITSAEKLQQYLKKNNFQEILLGNGYDLAKFTGISTENLNQYFYLVYEDGYYNLYKIK